MYNKCVILLSNWVTLNAGKCGRCVWLTLEPSCADCLEIWEHQPPGTPQSLSRPIMGLIYLHTDHTNFANFVTVSFITFFHIPSFLYFIVVYMAVSFVRFCLNVIITCSYCYVCSLFRFIVSFRVLFVCECVPCHWRRVSTQLKLRNISYCIIYFVLLISPLRVGGGKSEALHMRRGTRSEAGCRRGLLCFLRSSLY